MFWSSIIKAILGQMLGCLFITYLLLPFAILAKGVHVAKNKIIFYFMAVSNSLVNFTYYLNKFRFYIYWKKQYEFLPVF